MFQDRTDAGRQLADALAQKGYADPVVLALPRGGVPVGAEVARRLGAPLDLLMVRKLGAPWQPELAMGAVARSGESTEVVLNDEVIGLLSIAEKEIQRAKRKEFDVIAEREKRYFTGRKRPNLKGRTLIVVDDGVATGATTRVALHAARKAEPRRLVLAVPVAPPDTIARLRADADDIVCLHQPPDLGAIGFYYRDFSQVSDAQVMALLDASAEPAGEG